MKCDICIICKERTDISHHMCLPYVGIIGLFHWIVPACYVHIIDVMNIKAGMMKYEKVPANNDGLLALCKMTDWAQM